MDLELVIQKLAEATGLAVEQITAEIQAIAEKEGCTLTGAAQIWKSEPKNKAKIPKEMTTFFGKVLRKTEIREVDTKDGKTAVQDVQMIARMANSEEAFMADATLWGEERIKEIGDKLPLNAAVSFSASVNSTGKFVNVRNVIQVNDEAAPDIRKVKPVPIDNLKEAVKRNEFIHGWIGRAIVAQGTSTIIGFELGDLDGVQTVTVWFAGKYSKMEPGDIALTQSRVKRGVEVSAYGYVGGSPPDIHVNAVSVFFFD